LCGRFTLTIDPIELAEYFQIVNLDELSFEPSYNVAPTHNVVAVVNNNGKRKAGFLRWGLIPFWAKDSKSFQFINARAETLSTKPSFKHLSRRRCLILADSFFEWKKEGKTKKPFRILLKNKKPFAFAGLWDRWEHEGKQLKTCTIITTKPNEVVEPIHNRMPVILDNEKQSIWLDRNIHNWDDLKPILSTYPAKYMKAYEVSSIVNSPFNNSRKCIEPV